MDLTQEIVTGCHVASSEERDAKHLPAPKSTKHVVGTRGNITFSVAVFREVIFCVHCSTEGVSKLASSAVVFEVVFVGNGWKVAMFM